MDENGWVPLPGFFTGDISELGHLQALEGSFGVSSFLRAQIQPRPGAFKYVVGFNLTNFWGKGWL